MLQLDKGTSLRHTNLENYVDGYFYRERSSDAGADKLNLKCTYVHKKPAHVSMHDEPRAVAGLQLTTLCGNLQGNISPTTFTSF